MYTKKNTRVTFRSNRRPNFKRSNNFTNGKQRNKGNVTQQYNKYLKMAKESFSSGDRIQSEYYYQFTDHYYRIMVELGISFEENNMNDSGYTEDGIDDNKISDIKKVNVIITDDNIEEKIDKNKEDESTEDEIDSIESIPFISSPAKKKSSISSPAKKKSIKAKKN